MVMENDASEVEWLQQQLQASTGVSDDSWRDPTGGLLAKAFEIVENGAANELAVILKDLLDKHEADILNHFGPENDTLLHLACLYCHETCVVLLLEHGASTAVRDDDNSTVLHDAAAAGNLNIVRMIVDRQPDLLHALDNDGDCPLHNAARGGYTDIVQFLLLEGANPHVRNKHGHTPRETPLANGDEVQPGVDDALRIAEKEFKSDASEVAARC